MKNNNLFLRLLMVAEHCCNSNRYLARLRTKWLVIKFCSLTTAMVLIIFSTMLRPEPCAANPMPTNPNGAIGWLGTPIAGWEEVERLPHGVSYAGAGVLKDKIYVVGGMNSGYLTASYTNVFCFDGSAWAYAPALPNPVFAMAVAADSNALYVLGGFAASGNTAKVHRFDGTNWTEIASLPKALGAGAATVWRNDLYHIGGRDSTGKAQTNVYCYHLENGQWTEKAGLPQPRSGLTANVRHDVLYAAGDNETNSVYRYDLDQNLWTEVANLPQIMRYAAAGVLDDGMYIFGGASDIFNTNAYRYDGTNWVEFPGLPQAAYGLNGAVLSNQLYALGGLAQTTAGNGGLAEEMTANVYRSVLTDYTGVNPSSGPSSGGFQVVITGSGLAADGDTVEVFLCGVPATVEQVCQPTQIVVRANSAGHGTGNVQVYSPALGMTVRSNAFTYFGSEIFFRGTNDASVSNTAPANLSAGTDFGEVAWETAKTNLFKINNTGNDTLIINEINLTGSGAEAFQALPNSLAIPPDSSAGVSVIFTPAAQTHYSAAMEIDNNSLVQIYLVNLAGQGVKRSQTIQFDAIPEQVFTSKVDLTALASSGLPVTFTASPPGYITNQTQLAFTGTGAVAVTALQAGDSNWFPATTSQTVQATLYGPTAGKLSIQATPASGTWRLTDFPADFLGPFTQQGTLPPIAAPTGTYSIAWQSLPNYAEPLPETAVLTTGSTLTFQGFYLPESESVPPPRKTAATAGTYTNFIHLTWEGATTSLIYEIWRHTKNDRTQAVRLTEIDHKLKNISSLSKPKQANCMDYKDYDVTQNKAYFYWMRAKTQTLSSRFSAPCSGFAALAPSQTQGSADLALADLVFLPVAWVTNATAGTVSLRVKNYGPDNLTAKSVSLDFYAGTTKEQALWVGSSSREMTLPKNAEELIILNQNEKNKLRARADLPDGETLTFFARVRHLDGYSDPNPDNNWTPAKGVIKLQRQGAGSRRRGITDCDGDGKSDLLLARLDRGNFAWLASADSYQTTRREPTGILDPSLHLALGDYDGDGVLDLGLYAENAGAYYVRTSSNGKLLSLSIGGPGFIPAPGDYDGDGKTDPVVYHETDGLWLGRLSAANYQDTYLYLGGPGYLPVTGDYDGDGKTDPVVYANSESVWAGKLSQTGYKPRFLIFGPRYAQPVSGDYDGDGLTDLAFYQPHDGLWIIWLSQNGAWNAMAAALLGGPNYIPVPGDYDGDGLNDLVVYNPWLPNQWRGLLSSSDYLQGVTGQFGNLEYEPVRE